MRSREARQRHVAETERADADRQRAVAVSERKTAQAVVDFLTQDVLAKASPRYTRDSTVSDTLVKVMIGPALQTVDKQFSNEPLLRATIQETLARTLEEFGDYGMALPQIQSAWQTRQAVLGNRNPVVMETYEEYAYAIGLAGNFGRAEPMLRAALVQCRQTLGNDDPVTLKALGLEGDVLMGLNRYADAEPFLREAWDRTRQLRGDDDPMAVAALRSCASSLYFRDKRRKRSRSSRRRSIVSPPASATARRRPEPQSSCWTI